MIINSSVLLVFKFQVLPRMNKYSYLNGPTQYSAWRLAAHEELKGIQHKGVGAGELKVTDGWMDGQTEY